MNVPSFGEKIKVTAYLTRHKFGNKRKWMRNELDPPKDAVFIIKRTLANGKMSTEYHSDEGSDYYFTGDEYLSGAIVGIRGLGSHKVLLSDVISVCGLCGNEEKR